MEPDGSLCRITSSYKDLVNNVRIVKVPGSDPCVKLVLMKLDDESEESDKSSKISDDETDDELCNVKISSKSVEKESVADAKVDQLDYSNKFKNNERIGRERDHNYRPQTSFNRNNPRGRRNNFYKNKNVSNSRRNYNYSNRDFKRPASYNKPVQRSFDSVNPWMDQQAMHNFQCSTFTVASLPENHRSSHGLLGDRPLYTQLPNDQSLVYPSIPTNFQANPNTDNQNLPYSPRTQNFQPNRNNFLHNNQSASFSQMTSRYPSNNLTNDQNFWNNNYRGYNKRNMSRYENKRKQNRNKNRRRHSNDRNN